MTDKTREGMIYGLFAYGSWGLVPLYFGLLLDVTAAEILARQIVWSLVFLLLLIAACHRWRLMWTALRNTASRCELLLTALLAGINWFLYIMAVRSNQVMQRSL